MKTFSLFKKKKYVKLLLCEIVFQLLVEFYHRLSQILKLKYRDMDKLIMRGKHFIDKRIMKSLLR